MSKEIDFHKVLHENITPEYLEAIKAGNQNVDYRDEIRKIGWKPEMIPGEKTVTFRVRKGKTYWTRKISRMQLEAAYDPVTVKWQIWKELYGLITDEIESEMPSLLK